MIIHLKNKKEGKKILEIFEKMNICFEGEKKPIEIMFLDYMDFPTNIEFKQDYIFVNEKGIPFSKFLKEYDEGNLSVGSM